MTQRLPFSPFIHCVINAPSCKRLLTRLPLPASLLIILHFFQSLLPCVVWQLNTVPREMQKACREKGRREKRRKSINPPQGGSEQWAPPLSEVLGLAVTSPYLVLTHALFALHKLQSCLCPVWQPYCQSLICLAVPSFDSAALNGMATPYLIWWTLVSYHLVPLSDVLFRTIVIASSFSALYYAWGSFFFLHPIVLF